MFCLAHSSNVNLWNVTSPPSAAGRRASPLPVASICPSLLLSQLHSSVRWGTGGFTPKETVLQGTTCPAWPFSLFSPPCPLSFPVPGTDSQADVFSDPSQTTILIHCGTIEVTRCRFCITGILAIIAIIDCDGSNLCAEWQLPHACLPLHLLLPFLPVTHTITP